MKHYRIAHRLSWRTRIKAEPLRYFSGNMQALEESITDLQGIIAVRINPLSASVIIEHQSRLPEQFEIFKLIEQFLKRPCLYDSAKTKVKLNDKKSQGAKTHVSGKCIVVSGIYLFIRWLGGITFPGTLTFFLTTGLGITLSIPIIREEFKSIRETGKPGLTTLTTSALYYAMISGAPGSALSIFWLFNLSSWFETRTLTHTRNSIRDMLQSKTNDSWLIKNDVEILVPASTIVAGDTIRLVQGNVIGVDGIIENGRVLINEAVMTGESMPVFKKKGDKLFAGTVVETGQADLIVVSPERETRLASIIKFVENAESANTNYQRFSDQFGKRLFPISLALFAGTLLFTGNLFKAVSMLIITCPCAIRISTSTAVTAAMGNAAKQGILVKGGEYIEQAGKINSLVFDKTGTLTNGIPGVSRVVSLDKAFEPDQLLQLASAAQKPFKHPVTSAVLEKIRSTNLYIPHASDHQFSVGKGVSATIQNFRVHVGSESFMEECDVDCRDAVFLIKHMNAASESILFIAIDGKLAGLVGLSDLIKRNAAPVLDELKKNGIEHIAMLTGDQGHVADKAAKDLSVDEVRWELSPEKKAKWIINRKKHFPDAVIAMVGDGINDTPAFAHADLSIAIGLNGADTAIEYADIVIQKDDLAMVAEALFLGKKTRSIFRQNVTLTVLLNTFLCIFTAIGYVSPFSGALIHNLITLGVVGNSGRLLFSRSNTPESKSDPACNLEQNTIDDITATGTPYWGSGLPTTNHENNVRRAYTFI